MKYISVFALLFCISACVSYRVQVDSIAASTPPSGNKYVILPMDASVSATDLQFKEYAGYVKAALSQKGMQYADDSDTADLIIRLAYGIGEPLTEIHSVPVPVSGPIGVSSSKKGKKDNDTPIYGTLIGYSSNSVTTYMHRLELSAYDKSKTENDSHVWRLVLTSRNASEDLRQVFPIMIAASIPYIGLDTNQQVSVSLYEDDDAVKQLKAASGRVAQEDSK